MSSAFSRVEAYSLVKLVGRRLTRCTTLRNAPQHCCVRACVWERESKGKRKLKGQTKTGKINGKSYFGHVVGRERFPRLPREFDLMGTEAMHSHVLSALTEVQAR